MMEVQKYNIIDTKEKLKWLDTILMKDHKPVHPIMAYDTETNGIGLHRSTIVGFSLSFNKHSGFYIPLLAWKTDPKSRYDRTKDKILYEGAYKDGCLLDIWTRKEYPEFVTPNEYNIAKENPLIVELLKRWTRDSKLVMHNAPFDVCMTDINMGFDLTNNLLLDTALLVHILDENEPTALKKCIERFRKELGVSPHALMAQEKKELFGSIIRNGGNKAGEVWRASLEYQGKYACADTFYTMGVYEAAIKEFAQKFGKRGLDWFFNKEVMPVCKEVVIPMKKRGVYVDVPHFKKIHSETIGKLERIEDDIINTLNSQNLLQDFPLGKPIETVVNDKDILKKLIELEGLQIPTKKNAKGIYTETLAKTEVKKAYNENPHWVWGYILGEDEIKYNSKKMEKLKQEIYIEKMNSTKKTDLEPQKRYRFNINSKDHLQWLFCNKLGEDPAKLPQTKTATKEKPKPSFTAAVLKEHLLEKYPWVSKILSYKKLAKQESTYMRPVLVLNLNGWLYMDMRQNGTTSGRFACSGGFNLQTLPRVEDEKELLDSCPNCGAHRFNKDGSETGHIKITQEIEAMADRECLKCGDKVFDVTRPSVIKRGFIAPPGYKIVNADYSSLEPRIFAFMSNEDKLKDVYRKGLDLYSQVYCDMFDKENKYSSDPKSENFLKKLNPKARSSVKPFVLGVVYGAEDAQVARQINAYKEVFDRESGQLVLKLDVAKGKETRDSYLSTYPNLNNYMEEQEIKAVTYGYVETIVGRRRHLKSAKNIKEVLDNNGIDYTDLRKAPTFMLKGSNISSVNRNTGVMLNLPEDVLEEICIKLNIKVKDIKEKGGWKYIKHLLKEDLNNAKNNPIQGLAGHITNLGMLYTNRAFKSNNVKAMVFLQVHDEISTYVIDDRAHIDKAKELQKIAMETNEFALMVDIPMVADPLECYTLEDAK